MVLLLLVMLLVLPSLSQATTYYVAPSGGGSCSTNRNAPQGGVSQGVGCLSPGDTLYLRAGTYTETLDNGVTVTFPQGTSTNPITIAGDPGDPARSAIIRSPNGVSWVIGINNFGDCTPSCPNFWLVFDNLTLDGGYFTGNNSGAGVMGLSGSHITVKNSTLKNTTGNGIISGGSYNTYSNLDVSEVGHVSGHGYYLPGDHNIIENNTIHDSDRYGIQIFDSHEAGRSHDNIIRNNKIWNVNRVAYWAIVMSNANNLAYNNIIWNNRAGIQIDYGCVGCQAYNNTIYNNAFDPNSGDCVYVSDSSPGVRVQNNICWQNLRDGINNNAGATANKNLCQGAGCEFYQNPQFVNAGNADFHLQSNSPAIDQGTPISAFSTDLAGNPRPLGAGWDMGAYEVGGAPPPTRLRFTTQPQSTPVGQTMAVVVVQAQDASGNLASSFTGNITVGFPAGGAGVVPFGQTSVAFVDSEESGAENGAGLNAIDGLTAAGAPLWHTRYTPISDPYPHTLILNLGASYPVNGFRYLPRQDGPNGTIILYQFAVSPDGSTWGVPVAEGSLFPDSSQKTVLFAEKTGQYVWLQALSEINGNPWASALEITTLYNAGAGSCSGVLNGTTVVQATGGQASFTTLSVSAPGTCQLEATAAGLSIDTSNTFAITGSATHLGFVAQPSTVVVGQTLPPVTVQFLDAGNNPFPTTQAVNIALATCPGASLGGTASRAANASGLATFNDLSVTNATCPNATLVASASGMTGATSTSFAVLTTIPDPFLTGEWTAHGVASHACAATDGDTNLSGSTPGVDHLHTLTCPFPANVLTAGALLESCALVDATTQGTGTRPAFGLSLGGVVLSTSASTGTSPTLTTNAWLCFLTAITSPPGASVPTYTSFALEGPGFAFSGSKPGVTPQPVNAATSSPLTAGFISHWETAGDGLNTITLHSMILGLAH
jgi:hypothetical protein